MASSSNDATPTTLFDLLNNSLLLRNIAPHLPVASLFALARTSKTFFELVTSSPDAFRYLDLSVVSSAAAPSHEPLDSGAITWRAERMDVAVTEDEFYSGPLRGIFSKLQRRHLLKNVYTLVLDGLNVPADLVREIIAEDRFNVRILSIRECTHLNERKLTQVLKYAVRPTRPAGTPRLKGLYVFGPKDPSPFTDVVPKPQRSPPRTPENIGGVMASQGAQIGAEWNQKSSEALNTALARSEHKWYQTAGRVLHIKRPSTEWAETLKACEGIIFFDAVLCRGPRHDIETAFTQGSTPHPKSFLSPAVANVALGPTGCQSCHNCPEGPAVFGKSPAAHLPLLSPPPLCSSTVQAAQRPSSVPGSPPPILIARCEECLRGRWCERCNKWWDEDCYFGSTSSNAAAMTLTAMQQTEQLQSIANENGQPSNNIKGHQPSSTPAGVKRDCFGCGPTCVDCKTLYIRACHKCRNEFCILDNDGSSATACDWCNFSGRRTVELY
ncbi:uncharacterized protein IWZ02DRAFT_299642 [Phyllosticta citriasiana]|uniref:uncharacterized protein n=1 Tax=Phyllosticta citriasiana TaxID=595635 RepID=UPI0030FD22AA